MKTAIRYVKTEISKLSIDLPDEDVNFNLYKKKFKINYFLFFYNILNLI